MDDSVAKKTSWPIAAMVLGIISILTAFFYYLTLPTGILAIVFGAKTIRHNNSAMGKAGFILGIVGLSLFAFLYMSMFCAIVLMG